MRKPISPVASDVASSRPGALPEAGNGSSNYVEILRGGKQAGEKEIYAKPARVPLKKGDMIRMVTATGGGWGDPKHRPKDKLLDDIKNGYISAGQAARYRDEG